MSESDEFSRLAAVVRELRQKCAWDREQTLAGSSRHLIEEAYEAADAIASGDSAEIIEELGDLMVQVIFSSTLANETGAPQPCEYAHSRRRQAHPSSSARV
jgi:uncharacterized protein YabN with tetrapyrrole methylase and pyrophosphatase domain